MRFVFDTARDKFTYTLLNNQIQNEVIPKAYESRSNLVLCAPTGCGKTSVLEAGILQHYKRNLTSFVVVLYLSPVNSLLQERLKDWNLRFNDYTNNLLLSTEDNDDITAAVISQRIVSNKVNVILSTPEQWDFYIRKQYPTIKVSTVLLDEAHHIGDKSRGYILERLLITYNRCDSCRIIAVSATFVNIRQFGKWLSAPDDCIFYYGEEFRPVSLDIRIKRYSKRKYSNDFLFEKSLENRVPTVIKQYYSKGGTTGVLVFCTSRASAESLVKKLEDSFAPKTLLSNESKNLISTISSSELRHYISESRLAYHHSGVSLEDRVVIESLFASGVIKIIAATTTLAQGVNFLNLNLVIVQSTRYYCYESEKYQNIRPSLLHQMVGRAGRREAGTAVILTGTEDNFERLLKLEEIKSHFMNHENEMIVSHIVEEKVNDLASIEAYIESSFYAYQNRGKKQNVSLSFLLDSKVIDQNLQATSLGNVMYSFNLAIDTMLYLCTISPSHSPSQLLLNMTSNCKLFRSPNVILRRSEKKELNALWKSYYDVFDKSCVVTSNATLKKAVQSSETKSLVLLMHYIINHNKHKISAGLVLDTKQVVNDLRTLLTAIECFDIGVIVSPSLLKHSVLLSKSLRHRVWWSSFSYRTIKSPVIITHYCHRDSNSSIVTFNSNDTQEYAVIIFCGAKVLAFEKSVSKFPLSLNVVSTSESITVLCICKSDANIQDLKQVIPQGSTDKISSDKCKVQTIQKPKAVKTHRVDKNLISAPVRKPMQRRANKLSTHKNLQTHTNLHKKAVRPRKKKRSGKNKLLNTETPRMIKAKAKFSKFAFNGAAKNVNSTQVDDAEEEEDVAGTDNDDYYEEETQYFPCKKEHEFKTHDPQFKEDSSFLSAFRNSFSQQYQKDYHNVELRYQKSHQKDLNHSSNNVLTKDCSLLLKHQQFSNPNNAYDAFASDYDTFPQQHQRFSNHPSGGFFKTYDSNEGCVSNTYGERMQHTTPKTNEQCNKECFTSAFF